MKKASGKLNIIISLLFAVIITFSGCDIINELLGAESGDGSAPIYYGMIMSTSEDLEIPEVSYDDAVKGNTDNNGNHLGWYKDKNDGKDNPNANTNGNDKNDSIGNDKNDPNANVNDNDKNNGNDKDKQNNGNTDNNGNHYGWYKDDDGDGKLDEDFEQQICYLSKNQDVYFYVGIGNPSEYEIFSLTISGQTYTFDMFEANSTNEVKIVKYNVGDSAGIVEYVIEQITYYDGKEFKNIDILGNNTARAGIKTEDQVTATVTRMEFENKNASFDITISDIYGLIAFSNGSAKLVLHEGDKKTEEKELTVGENSVTFKNLKKNTTYQYEILAFYDDLSGDEPAYHTLIEKRPLEEIHTHVFGEWVTVLAPTCQTEGIEEHSCECEETERRTIPTVDHTEAIDEATAPTCTVPGLSEGKRCSVCNKILLTQTVTSPLGHDFKITQTVDATCTEDGKIILECQRDNCNASKQQALPATGHDLRADGTCKNCDYSKAPGHSHFLIVTVVRPSCTEMGYTLYACDCGYSFRTSYVEQKGHLWNNGTVEKAKTCTTDGVMLYTCIDCGETHRDVIKASHNWVEYVITETGCIVAGELSRVCTDCGKTENVIIAPEHTWGEPTAVKPATCTEVGLETRTCEKCGVTQDFETKSLGHKYVNGVCTECGAEFIDGVTPYPEHLDYGMYFEIDDIVSRYGPDYINKYGVLLDYNEGAKIEKVAVFLTQDGTMWRRCIAVVGTDIEYATYVPYLSYGDDVKYTGLNSNYINIFKLSENSKGIWCYNNYTTIGANLEDKYGNLLLSLYDIGQAGAKTRVFDDLNEMIAWLLECEEHTESDWILDSAPSCTEKGSSHKECTVCGAFIESKEIPETEHSFNADGVCENCGEIRNSEGLEYTLSDDKTYYIVSGIGSCTDTDIVIPDKYNNLPVQKIGFNAFACIPNIKSVFIPNSIVEINSNAFWCCYDIENIIVDDKNTEYKSVDGHLYTEDGTILLQYAIGRTDLTFTVPKGVTHLAGCSFEMCHLESVIIANDVIEIGSGAFLYSDLKNIVIGEGVVSIGGFVFDEFSSLQNIYYMGTAEAWDRIDIDDSYNNSKLHNTTRYYYSETQPTVEGNFWHYVDGVPTVWGAEGSVETTTVTVVIENYANANGWINATQYSSLNMDDNITVIVSGGMHTGKYYTSNNSWRIYQSETPSIVIFSNTGKITSVKITYDVANTGVLTLNDINIASGAKVTLNTNFVTFGVGNTGTSSSGQVRITSIEVTYTNAADGEKPACEHENTSTTTVDATCVLDGSYTVICDDCGEIIVFVILPATKESNVVHMEAVAPGCHYDGNIEYWICYDCEQVWVDEALTQLTNIKNVVLPATGDTAAIHVEAVAPGCHYYGNIEYWICYSCEQVWQDEALTQLTNIKNVVIPATGDTAVIHVEAVTPCCLSDGNIEYWYCEKCEQVWQDEALTQLTNRLNVILPALGHTEAEAVVENVNQATCTVNGSYDSVIYCYVCAEEISRVTLPITAPGHNIVDNKCTRCDYTVDLNCKHSFTLVDNNGIPSYICSDCNLCYVLDGGMLDMGDFTDVTTSGLYNKTIENGKLTMLNNGANSNAQHQFWVPGNREAEELLDFTNANNAIGVLSFSINAKDHHNTGIEFRVNANRGTTDWSWANSSVSIFKVKPTAEGATSVALTGYNFADLGSIAVTGENGWTGWIDVIIVIKLTSDNKISVDYYINGEFFKNITGDMLIWTYEINSLYITGRTNGEGQGYELKDFYFGFTLNGIQTPVVDPFYDSVIDANSVKSEALKTIVASKFKQCDQCTTVNAQGGTPVYVLAEKDGEYVEALYVSRTYPWAGDEAEQFTEFRFAVNGESREGPATTSFSFDYKARGTVEKNERYQFTDLKGNKFYSDAYVQIKTATTHPLACDNYPELSGTDLILDGEWHTITVTFDEPLVILDILINLYHFQGEILIANLNVTSESSDCAHEWINATCTAPKICKVCGATEGDRLPHEKGTVTQKNVIEPDCVTDGSYDEVTHCALCGNAYLTTTVTTPKLGHDVVDGKCTRCDYTIDTNCKHSFTLVDNNGVPGYICSDCGKVFELDNYVYYPANGESAYTGLGNGKWTFDTNDGVYRHIFSPSTDMPESSEGLMAGQVVGDWAWFNGFGGQAMTWIPTNASGKGLQGFSCANNASGIISFRMRSSMTDSFMIRVGKERNASDWSGWSTSSVPIMQIGGYSDSGITIKTGLNSLSDVTTIPTKDGWSEWFDVVIAIQLKDNNTISINFYINGKLVSSVEDCAMPIDTGDIRVLSIIGWTYQANTGFELDDIVLGYFVDDITVTPPECEHNWVDATCTSPKTCSLCGIRSGSPINHTYGSYVSNNDASCTVDGTKTAKCITCGASNTVVDRGSALGHDYTEASCTTPATCKLCGATTGKPLGHTGGDADCSKPKVCEICGEYYSTLGHRLVQTYVNSVPKYTCTVCNSTYELETYYYYNAESDDIFTYYGNGTVNLDATSGKYSAIFTPKTTDEESVGGQSTFWIPSMQNGSGIPDFTCANSTFGIISFSMRTNASRSVVIRAGKERAAADWTDWTTSSMSLLQIGGYSEDGITVKAGLNSLSNVATIKAKDGWSEWFDVMITIQLKTDNTVSVELYINGESVATFIDEKMCIDTYDIRALYISASTYTANTGIELDNIVFGHTLFESSDISGCRHSWTEATCTTPKTCSLCGVSSDDVTDSSNHVNLIPTYGENLITYTCECGYTFSVDIFDYLDGTDYEGMSSYASINSNRYITNTPLNADDYYEFIRKSDDAGENSVRGQAQWWLPTNRPGTNKFSDFSSENGATGVLSFSINAYTDFWFDIKLVDNRVDVLDGEHIRWQESWCIQDSVFKIGAPANGKVELKGFNNTALSVVDVDESNYTGWIDVTIRLVLDAESDTIIATYFINGKYVCEISKDLTTHTNAIQAVYFNTNNTAAGTGYKIDNIVFGYTLGNTVNPSPCAHE